MFKKFFSNALLSVVMDKTARKRLEKIRTRKEPDKTDNTKKIKVTPTQTDDLLNMIIDEALEEARRQAATPDATPRTKKPARPAKPQKPGGADRKKLIAKAMDIHRQKTHILNDLDPAALDKLALMATYALDPDSLSPKVRKELATMAKSEGLVNKSGKIIKPRR